MICEDLEDEIGRVKVRLSGAAEICILKADSHCCLAET